MFASGEFIFRIDFNMHRLTPNCLFIQMIILEYSK